MIRVREEQWIMIDAIESVFIKNGDVLIVPNSETTLPYYVEEKFLTSVCSSLSLPFSIIQGVRVRQTQEKNDGQKQSEETGPAS